MSPLVKKLTTKNYLKQNLLNANDDLKKHECSHYYGSPMYDLIPSIFKC